MKTLKRFNRQFAVYWVPLIVWMGVIFMWSSLSANTLRKLNPSVLSLADLAHFANFAVLAILAYRALCTFDRFARLALWSLVIVFTVLYALSDEVHQAFIPGRSPSAADLAIDTAGGIAGLILADVLRHRLRRRRIGPS